MIFVTVGTHEQPFNRLIEEMDRLKGEGILDEDVIMQTGFSTYKPKYCEWSKLVPYSRMLENVRNARIVITHGGPASFIMPLQVGKVPIVVPRQLRYGEHVNDHQVEFTRAVAERIGNIIPVYDIKNLAQAIADYDERTSHLNKNGLISNNQLFNQSLEQIVIQFTQNKDIK